MLSGKSSGCGIAYVGVLCSSTVGYGVSSSLNANFDPANPVPPVWDIIVVSHEIGHNFNSPHTHCYDEHSGRLVPGSGRSLLHGGRAATPGRPIAGRLPGPRTGLRHDHELLPSQDGWLRQHRP